MSENYQYPKEVDFDRPLPSNLLPLWEEAMQELKSRRNKNLGWLALGFLIALVALFTIPFQTFLILFVITIAVLGFIGQGLSSEASYSVNTDRSKAWFDLRNRFRFSNIASKHFNESIEMMKGDAGGCLIALPALVLSPVTIFIQSLLFFAGFFTKVFWLSDFHVLDQELRDEEDEDESPHVRGTEILTPVELTGDGPTANQSDDGSLEVLDGNLTLNPDGGLELMSGASFDINSTFENLSMGDLVLTRKDAGLLRVQYEGEDHAFFYNGSEWSQV